MGEDKWESDARSGFVLGMVGNNLHDREMGRARASISVFRVGDSDFC